MCQWSVSQLGLENGFPRAHPEVFTRNNVDLSLGLLEINLSGIFIDKKRGFFFQEIYILSSAIAAWRWGRNEYIHSPYTSPKL